MKKKQTNKQKTKKQLSTGEMYINHYGKRVANNKPWKRKKQNKNFKLKLFWVLHKILRVSSLGKDVAYNRKDCSCL